MPEIKTTGIVLHRTNFGEADRIVKILSRDTGMLTALARGVKKVKSKRAGAFEIFSTAELTLHRRSGELFVVGSASNTCIHNFDLNRLAIAYSAAEWILTLLPAEKPLPETFDLLTLFLFKLEKSEKPTLLEAAFRLKILEQLGYLPDLDNLEERVQKLAKFLLNSDLDSAEKVELDETTKKISEWAIEIFESASERKSRVSLATASWN